MGTAEDLYARMKTAADIDHLVQTEVEGLNLDFKERRGSGLLARDDDLMRALAKGVSALANSDGGVLVIGVQDAPRQRAPFPHLKQAHEELNEQLARVVRPNVPGVQSKRIETAAGSDEGVLVVLVPASDEGPHMNYKDKCYYRRHAESSMKMEHYEVAEMFGRRPGPSLRIELRSTRRDARPNPDVLFRCHAVNVGRGLARFIMIEVLTCEGGGVRAADPHWPWTQPRLPGVRDQFRADANFVIHSHSSFPVFDVVKSFRWGVEPRPAEAPAISLTVRVHADGVPARVRTIVVSNAQFAAHFADCTESAPGPDRPGSFTDEEASSPP